MVTQPSSDERTGSACSGVRAFGNMSSNLPYKHIGSSKLSRS